MQQLFDLIENTNRNIFLTGRAGTGKTTFLQHFVQHTSKKVAIAAPTGIAAVNAGGVTIHSLFGLPLTTFAPTMEFIDPNVAINIPNLLPHFKYRRDKLKLLRTIELLIIDEASMLRCDVLDMIDLALRSARKSQQIFGGLQILFIGDLYQLPPVVKVDTGNILYSYYNSPFFFEAKAFQKTHLITYTLTKVYRQSDATFLHLLNAIRNNDIDNIDFDLLHSRYQPDFDSDEFYVHLVSHNHMADTINNKKMQVLPGKSTVYNAIIQGDFKPHLYPTEENLILKIGAQVMFIKNDSTIPKRFFNGKLATITALGENEIKVTPQGETETLTIHREIWENKKYYVDETNKIAEEVVGSYQQFPFKLAWAVTIHKSQGLTFDKVIIDAGQSFTSGQVYVALSRCRTLEGIVLKSKIPAHAIIHDKRITAFEKETEIDTITPILETEKYEYGVTKLLNKLNIIGLSDVAERWQEAALSATHLNHTNISNIVDEISTTLRAVEEVFHKFSVFATNKVKQYIQLQTGWEELVQKSAGAVNFFFNEVNEKILIVIKESYAETKGVRGLKLYNDIIKDFIEMIGSYLKGLQEAKLLDTPLYNEELKITVQTEVDKKPSHITTYQLLEEGKSISEIAAYRNITESTVLSHLAKVAHTGILDITKIFSIEDIKLFEKRFSNHHFNTLTEWKNVLPDFFDYNQIRILLNHFNYYKNTKHNSSTNNF